jgi:tetratricopeptide (TPR) repeat protein
MWDAALQVAESEASGSNASKAVAHILEQLVCAHYELGDLERAEDVCKRALIIISSHYGSRHTKAGNCLNNLAGIYFRGKRYSDAEAICHTVLSIYEMSYGRQHPEVGLALHNLAMIYHAQKKYMHAEKHYRRAFALTAAGLKPTDPTAVKVATNYATLLESTGRKSEAERIRGKLQSAKHN